ncbi:MAG TPA: hypothetical protein VHB73_01410 [Alphaproteobacteria bacterium]|nr:hypothetical protein [Alphaproteobacteria bacterium]
MATWIKLVHSDEPPPKGRYNFHFRHPSELIAAAFRAYLENLSMVDRQTFYVIEEDNGEKSFRVGFRATEDIARSITLALGSHAHEHGHKNVTRKIICDGLRDRGFQFGPLPALERLQAIAVLDEDAAKARRLYGPIEVGDAIIRADNGWFLIYDPQTYSVKRFESPPPSAQVITFTTVSGGVAIREEGTNVVHLRPTGRIPTPS